MTETHESYCDLSNADIVDGTPKPHYGPCAPTICEFYITDDEGNVLWRQAYPKMSSGYSDDPESRYQRVERPAYEQARDACLEAAFRFGYLPSIRHHSHYTDSVEWPIEVKEIEPYGDVLLTLPMGTFRLNARRARPGQTTSHQTVLFGGAAVGFGEVATEEVPEPVKLFGRVSRYEYSPSGYVVQPSHFEYADGTDSGFLGVYPTDITKVEVK